MKKTVVYTLLALSFLVIYNGTLQAQKKNSSTRSVIKNDEGIQTFHVEGDLADSTKNTIFLYKDGKKYVIKTENEKISELTIDDKKMPESSFGAYELVVKKVMTQLKVDRAQAEKDLVQAEIDRKQSEKDLEQAELDKIQAEKDMVNAEVDKKLAEEELIIAMKNREEVLEVKRLMEQEKKQADADYQQAIKDKKQAMRDKVQAETDAKQALLDKKQAEEDKATLESIVKDLVTAKVITNEKDLKSLYLTNGVLIVNDQKQPDNLQEQFKTRYLKKKNRQINYYSENGSTRFSSITVDD